MAERLHFFPFLPAVATDPRVLPLSSLSVIVGCAAVLGGVGNIAAAPFVYLLLLRIVTLMHVHGTLLLRMLLRSTAAATIRGPSFGGCGAAAAPQGTSAATPRGGGKQGRVLVELSPLEAVDVVIEDRLLGALEGALPLLVPQPLLLRRAGLAGKVLFADDAVGEAEAQIFEAPRVRQAALHAIAISISTSFAAHTKGIVVIGSVFAGVRVD